MAERAVMRYNSLLFGPRPVANVSYTSN